MKDTSDDFDPKEAFQTLSANIEQPDKFAELFCNAARKQKSIDGLLKEIIRELLQYDKQTIDCIKKYQREIDKEDWRFFLKKVGNIGWGFVCFLGGSVVTAITAVVIKSHF